MDNLIPQEAYYPLSLLFNAIGVGLGVMGALNVLEGRNNNVPSTRELGERQIIAGGNFVILSTYIKNGTLPAPEIMEYLATR